MASLVLDRFDLEFVNSAGILQVLQEGTAAKALIGKSRIENVFCLAFWDGNLIDYDTSRPKEWVQKCTRNVYIFKPVELLRPKAKDSNDLYTITHALFPTKSGPKG